MSYKTRDGKTHQTSVIISENGLPVDSIATIAGSYIFLEDNVNPLLYGGGTVTFPAGSDLTSVTTAKARYTGKYILLTNDKKLYYIDRPSINVAARTLLISTSDKVQNNPASIDLSPGWTVAEADIVNRLATTSAAKIDSVEFRDVHFQMQLDGDPVTLLNQAGQGINPATEEKQNDQISELNLINDELDTHTIHLQEINDELNTQTLLLQSIDQSADATETAVESLDSKVANGYGLSSEAVRTASQIGNAAGAADFNSGPTTDQTLRTAANIQVAGSDVSDTNPVPVSDVSLLYNIKYDDIQASYPSPTVENYEYYLATVLQATIEVTYTKSTKEILVRARRI
jgi:hypothetical protein